MKVSRTKLLGAVTLALFLVIGLSGGAFAGTTGKIVGKVVDKESGESLPAVNVTIVGTNLGAATNVKGEYFILNIPPGSYSVRAHIIGYGAVTQTNVRVSIDQTTTVNFTGGFALAQEVIAGQEVTIVSERPVVQPDVSANIANVSSTEIENIPITSVTEAIDLQAGIEPGLNIRGGGAGQLSFQIDGLTLRNGRDNTPFTTISYTSIDEFQVQTGGFNAEYGNVRSGLINVVTKDAPRDRYTADALVRYQPARKMNFGPGPKDANGYWIRPYLDSDISGVGTAGGPWDRYTQRQYPDFDGWNLISQNLADDGDPSNDLSVAQLQEIFKYHHRKDTDVNIPTYELDATVGGPLIPGGSSKLGNARFIVSYRGTQTPYFYPQAAVLGDQLGSTAGYPDPVESGRDAFRDDLVQGKITVDLKPTMKVNLQGLWAKATGQAFGAFSTVNNPNPQPGGIGPYSWSDHGMLSDNADHVGRSAIFGTDRYSIADVENTMFGASFTHTLNPSTFYELSLNRLETNYDSHPSRRRDFSSAFTVGGTSLDEAPFGWTSNGTNSIGSGLRLGGHWARARDTSRVAVYTGKFDITSQLNRISQFKAGVEVIYSDYDMTYGSDDSVIVHLERSNQQWQREPIQGAAYVQNKLEFKGMIANLGVRMDYFDPGGDWWIYGAYDRSFTAKNKNTRDELLETAPTDKQLTLSPRLGVSFPITVDSKLYFNYGFFRQMLTSRELYQIERQWLGNIGNIGDPNQPMPRTIAYELGYDHNLFDQYLLRVSGYYRDNELQPRSVQFTSIDAAVNYNVSQPLNYSDVRGFEITLNKIRGKWLRGFVNYTFMQFKSGNFAFGQQLENTVDQRNYERTSTDHYQNKPVSQPYASFNLEFLTPQNYGPSNLLGDFRVSFLGGWRAGQSFTWAGDEGATIPGLQNNIRMKDFLSLDLRISKNIATTSSGRAQLFLDVNNIFNIKQMYFNPFNVYGGPFESSTSRDFGQYMGSLHLPESTYKDLQDSEKPLWIPGNDRPGSFRKDGVAFVPIEVRGSQASLPSADDIGALEANRRVLGYATDSGTYYELVNGAWQQADAGFVKQVLNDKAYIDMPNEIHRTFLNPRTAVFGVRVSF